MVSAPLIWGSKPFTVAWYPLLLIITLLVYVDLDSICGQMGFVGAHSILDHLLKVCMFMEEVSWQAKASAVTVWIDVQVFGMVTLEYP